MIDGVFGSTVPWAVPLAMLTLAGVLLPARWQDGERTLRTKLERDLRLWAAMPAGWAKLQMARHIEREVAQLTDITQAQRLRHQAVLLWQSIEWLLGGCMLLLLALWGATKLPGTSRLVAVLASAVLAMFILVLVCGLAWVTTRLRAHRARH